MTYLIEATIKKDGGTVVHWKRYSNTKLTKKECLKILGDDKHTKLENFSCDEVKNENKNK